MSKKQLRYATLDAIRITGLILFIGGMLLGYHGIAAAAIIGLFLISK